METTDAVHVSLVHARFAADLLVGVQEELLRLTTDLDVYMDRADCSRMWSLSHCA